MQLITLREFRASLSRYIASMKEGKTFEVNGVCIGMCTRSEVTKQTVYTQEDIDFVDKVAELPVEPEVKCSLCKRVRECRKTENDIGDEVLVCFGCVSAKLGKMAKAFWSKLNRA